MRHVVWPYIIGSNSMATGMAWRSVTDKLDEIGIDYSLVFEQKRHCVAMSDVDFTLFALQWDNKGLGHLKWQTVSLPDAPE